MSLIRPRHARVQVFFRSAPSPCPYLPGRIERKLFTRLTPETAATANSELTPAGFRRSHDIVYRPVCPGCQACVSVRIAIARFRRSRTQRRLARLNADLTATLLPPLASEEQFQLFRDYQRTRHGDGDMALMGRGDYFAMVQDGDTPGGLLELRDGQDRLCGVMLYDQVADGASAVYSFYDPSQPVRSLGTELLLRLVESVAEAGLPHLYLGYWIAGAAKMAYKGRFNALERLEGAVWRPMAPQPDQTQSDHPTS